MGNSNLNISTYKVMDVSTGNLPLSDRVLLGKFNEKNALIEAPVRVVDHSYGYFVNVQDEPDELPEELEVIKRARLSEHFIAIYKLAIENKCIWINFDVDAEYVEGLEAFE